MPQLPWATGNRRIPIAIQGGTAVKLSPPGQLSGYDDAWTGLICTPTANRAVTDVTLTLNAPATGMTGMESGAHSTTGRLVGLHFKFNGEIYRITAQTGAAITFVSTTGAAGLHSAMTANLSQIKIQADLPPLISKLMFQCGGFDILYSYEQDTTAAGGSYFTIANPMSELLIDNEVGGVVSPPIFLVGSAAQTIEVKVMNA